jgi:hypothetical protein
MQRAGGKDDKTNTAQPFNEPAGGQQSRGMSGESEGVLLFRQNALFYTMFGKGTAGSKGDQGWVAWPLSLSYSKTMAEVAMSVQENMPTSEYLRGHATQYHFIQSETVIGLAGLVPSAASCSR